MNMKRFVLCERPYWTDGIGCPVAVFDTLKGLKAHIRSHYNAELGCKYKKSMDSETEWHDDVTETVLEYLDVDAYGK